MSFSKITALILVATFSIALTACSGGSSNEIRLQGAGATFPNPLYQKWLSEYGKAHANIKIDYQSIGSGGGIKQIQARTVDFGASDSPMKDEDLKAAPGEILHIPTVLGAVVITYNLSGVSQPLHFSPDVVADIFLGKIKKWNDARIKADNAGRFARVDHRCRRCDGVSDFQLHLHARLQSPGGRNERQGPCRFSLVGNS